MNVAISRREFVRLAAALAVPQPFDGAQGKPRLDDLPRFAGTLDVDLKTREALAVDIGRNVRRVPLAVLKPGSVGDVADLVRYCNRRGLKVAMRGQAHSQYGQTLVENGIVIDSSSLAAVRLVDDTSVDACAGATWAAVTQATVARRLTPPVMPDTMSLSVGGTLSVGGWGNTSHLYGAVVDNVLELEVVTGDGRLMTCSSTRERELFHAVLAGLGQCGFIVRARLRLMPAPAAVARRQFEYDNLDEFLTEVTRFAAEGRFDHLEPRVIRKPEGGWVFRIMAGRFETESRPDSTSYEEYLARTEPELAALRAARQGGPQRSGSVTMFIPAGQTRDLVSRVMMSPTATAGLWRFGCAPMIRNRYTRPLFRLPDSDTVFGLWLFRAAPADDAVACAAMDEGSASLFMWMQIAGGRFYAPYSGFPSRETWRQHYGAAWNDLVAARRRFDPAGVLTPGPGIFS